MITAVVVVVLALGAPPAGAHARLEATTPEADSLIDAPPDQVELRFTERIDLGLGGVRIIGPDGERADTGQAERSERGRVVTVPVEADREGTYTVAWSVISNDSHPISGSFVFSVGRETGPAESTDGAGRVGLRTAAWVARWLAFTGTVVVAGALAFGLLVLPAATVEPSRRRRLARVAVAGAVLVTLGAVGVLVSQVALASGRGLLSAFGLVSDAVTNTRLGAFGAMRLGLGVAALAAAVLALRAAGPTTKRLAGAVLLLSAAGLVVVPSLAGHAWTGDPRLLAVLTDVVHLGAASVWLGGLCGLVAVAPGTDGAPALARRFSTVALGAVVAVSVTGAVSGYLQLRSWDALTDTGFGRLLIVKVVLVGVLVALGWINRGRLVALLPDRQTLFGVVRAEIAVGLIVLAVTAALVNRPPGRDDLPSGPPAPSGPFTTSVTASDPTAGGLTLEVVPATQGPNDLHLYFETAGGEPRVVDAVEVTVASQGVPARRVEVTPVTTTHVSCYAVAMPTSGDWTVTVTTVREGEATTVSAEVPIP